jgi:8-oxo-dGTP pyrophosphatase MutT (NUDIX family)
MADDLIIKLEEALKSALPGNRAHQEMISYSRPIAEVVRELDVNPRESAVLILLYQENENWYFPLIKRQEYNGVHSKQIGLPGGKFEIGDKDLQYTSIRETKEELGVDPDHIQILGNLSEIYIPPSNFIVKPYIGYLSKFKEFVPDKYEVNRVIKTSLENLISLPIEKKEKFIRDGNLKAKVSSFIIDNEVVWGATAMILNEFRTIINDQT